MKILVDADACPVVRIVEQTAERYKIPVVLLCDTNHVLQSSYSEIKVIGAGADAVDFALVNQCGKGDIVVTQDYGSGEGSTWNPSKRKMVHQREYRPDADGTPSGQEGPYGKGKAPSKGSGKEDGRRRRAVSGVVLQVD